MHGDVILEGSRWEVGPTSFGDPGSIIVAWTVDEVAGSIRRAEEAAVNGSWVVGYVSYDAAPGFDSDLSVPGVGDSPLLWFGVYNDPVERIADYQAPDVGAWSPTMSPDEHALAVDSIRKSIESGDTYQANLTFAMRAQLEGSAADLFRRMVRSQRNSYGAFLDLGDSQVLSVSPELFLKRNGQKLITRPMKGTAPRGVSSMEDEVQMVDLLASEKERAGNIMIVDLLRNDLGRIAETGSVVASELFHPEKYPTVWQLTSTVECAVRDDLGLVDILAATFPSGSVTGAPKVSTMGIIADLESIPRGVYCGAIGYIAPGGDKFEFSVAIRTGVVRGGEIQYHVGGGITHDSMAGAEYEECLWKALVVTGESVAPSLLETMLYRPGVGIELLEGHMRRLSASASYWEIAFDPIAIGDALSVVEGHRDLKVRLILTPGGVVVVEVHELDVISDPVELTMAKGRVDQSEPLWFHKTLERGRYPDPENGEVVLVNLRDEVTETNISNLMVRIGDTWVTPPLESGCLPGVFRHSLIDAGQVVERVVTVDDFRSADEIAVTNAVRGWRKAVLIG